MDRKSGASFRSFSSRSVKTDSEAPLGGFPLLSRTSLNERKKYLLTLFLVATCYFLLGWMGMFITLPPGNLTPVWMPSGFALGCLFLFGPKLWPAFLLGSYVANLVPTPFPPDLFGQLKVITGVFSLACMDTFQPLLGYWLYRKFGDKEIFSKGRNIFIFAGLSVILTNLITCWMYPSLMILFGLIPPALFADTSLTFALADANGIFIMAPFVIVWGRNPSLGFNKRKCVEILLWLLSYLVLGYFIVMVKMPLIYALLPLLMWGTISMGEKGATVGILLAALISILGAIHNEHLFLGPKQKTHHVFLMMESFISIFTLATLYLNAILQEKKQVNLALQEHQENLEKLIEERTFELKIRNHQLGQEIQERKQAEQERQKLEIQLRHTKKMEAIGTLAGGIAHDFNNILHGIILSLEMVKDDLVEGHPLRPTLDMAFKLGKRATELVRQILIFSRYEEQKHTQIDLVAVLEESLTMIRATFPTSIEIIHNFSQHSEAKLKILASPVEIHQIILNLCQNASLAMKEEKGTIQIKLEQGMVNADEGKILGISEGEYIKISVQDSGIGIESRIKERIFEPFFTTREVGQGTGMGLAVVHGIVKNLHGAIEVESEIGKGSLFTLYFPLGPLPLIQEEETSPFVQSMDKKTGRILIVDDEELIVELEKSLLESMGHHVVAAANSLQALEIFGRDPDQFDLVITDQTMPHMTGLDLAKAMLKIKPNLPILLISGYSNQVGGVENADEVGIFEYLLKPLDKEKLHSAIQESLKVSLRK